MKNEGNQERILRFVLSISLALIAYFYISGIFQIILFTFSVLLLITAITGFCLLYRILGFSTCKSCKKSK